MNNWCIFWFLKHIFTGDFNFKGLIARRLYKSFGVKGLIERHSTLRKQQNSSAQIFITVALLVLLFVTYFHWVCSYLHDVFHCMLFHTPLLLWTTVFIPFSFYIFIHFAVTLLTTNASVNTRTSEITPKYHHALRIYNNYHHYPHHPGTS
jgi:amino acid transporter